MEPSHRGTGRHEVAELFAQLVWVIGALGSFTAGAVLGALAAACGLAITFGATLLLARRSTGWRAVPAMFTALLLQAPLLVGLGVYELGSYLGRDPYPCFFWRGTDLQLVRAGVVVVALSIPIGVLLRLERGGLRRVRWIARRVAPFAAVASAILALLGAIRFARFPTPDRYVASLPVHATIPAPKNQPCTPIEEKEDPKHDSGRRWDECATPEFDASPLSFHYHVHRSGDRSSYTLQVRTKAGHDRPVGVWYWSTEPPELPVRRDDLLDAWIVQRAGYEANLVTRDAPRWWVRLREIRARVAPPLGWSVLAGVGALVALACFGASSGLGRLASARSPAGEEWLAERRGDLAIVALAAALCSSALLMAALARGFLT